MRGVICRSPSMDGMQPIQSAHPMRGDIDCQRTLQVFSILPVSMRTPHARCDRRGEFLNWYRFNPHTSCEV